MSNDVPNQLATPRGNYPHVKRAGDFLFVSGISSRRSDNSFEGASTDERGVVSLDIQEQTRAVLRNIRSILAGADAALEDLVQVNCFLVDMKDFKGYNEAYAEFFPERGPNPTRTTVAVHQLPHPHILIEINAIAFKPMQQGRRT